MNSIRDTIANTGGGRTDLNASIGFGVAQPSKINQDTYRL